MVCSLRIGRYWLLLIILSKRMRRPDTPKAIGQLASDQEHTRVLINDPSLEIFMAAAIAFQDVRKGKRWLTMPTTLSIRRLLSRRLIRTKDDERFSMNSLSSSTACFR